MSSCDGHLTNFTSRLLILSVLHSTCVRCTCCWLKKISQRLYEHMNDWAWASTHPSNGTCAAPGRAAGGWTVSLHDTGWIQLLSQPANHRCHCCCKLRTRMPACDCLLVHLCNSRHGTNSLH